MIKKFLLKIEIFMALYGQTLALFIRHWVKFCIISSLFFVPLFALDEWVYAKEHYLNSLFPHLYSFVDGLLYLAAFIFLIFYLFTIQSAVLAAEKEKSIKVFSILKNIPLYVKSFFYIQIRCFLKVFLGLVLFVLPGILGACLYSFEGIAFIVDGKQGKEALLSSKLIVSRNLNKFFDILVLFLILQTAIFIPFFMLINQAHYFMYSNSWYFLASCVDFWIVMLFMVYFLIMQIFYYYFYQEMKKE